MQFSINIISIELEQQNLGVCNYYYVSVRVPERKRERLATKKMKQLFRF